MDVLLQYYYIIIPLIILALYLIFSKQGEKRPRSSSMEKEVKEILDRMLTRLPNIIAETGKIFSKDDQLKIAMGILTMAKESKLNPTALDNVNTLRLMALAVIDVLEKKGLIG